MASLDKLASMDGWGVSDDVTDGSVRPAASVTRPQCTLKDAVGGTGPAIAASAPPGGSEGGASSLHNRKESERSQSVEVQAGSRSSSGPTQSVKTPISSVRGSEHMLEQPAPFGVRTIDSQSDLTQSAATLKDSSSSVPLASGMTSHKPDEVPTNSEDQAVTGEHKSNNNNNNCTPVSDELLPCTHAYGHDDHPAAAVKKLDSQTGESTFQAGLSSSSTHHLIGTSRKGGPFGSDCSGNNNIEWSSCSDGGGGGDGGGGDGGGADVTFVGGASEAVIANLKASLRKEQDERARQEKTQEMLEGEARAAYASLEAKSRRTEELENRVRVMTMTSSTSGGGSGESSVGVDGDLFHSSNRWRRARSMSPVSVRRTRGRETVNAERAERQAQMAVIADATETARVEAQSALDVIEGFVTLNRKLVDELRTAVSGRDDLLESLSAERGFRHQLEGEVEELLSGGMALAVAEKEHELEVRCEQQHQDAMRAAALHSRMEEEYRCALKSSSQECARLESWAERLEGELLDERRSHELRAKEEAERAAMGAEEVGSIRAGLAPRTKRLGHDQSSPRLSNGKNKGRGGRRQSGGGWREVKPGRRIDMQQHNRGDQKKGLLATLNSNCPLYGSNRVEAAAAAGIGLISSGGIERRKTRDGGGSLDKADAGASYPANVGGGSRSTPLQLANRAGNLFVGAGRGAGGLGCEVYAAAVESVEMFLGDFVPAVRSPPSSAVAAAAQEKVGGPAVSSRWKAIGQGGRLSARALAMCAKEVDTAAKVEAHACLRSLINGSAQVLSSSWFFLLSGEATAPAAASGGAVGRDGATGDVLRTAGVSSEATATVSIVAVRRLAHTCGVIRSGAGGPTLAHADMQLRRNAVGKGRLGYREYFKTMMSLVRCRFAGESKESALEKISTMLKPASPEIKNAIVGTVAAANSVGSAESSLEGMHLEDMLAGAERVLKRDRRALEAIFSHYATVFSPEAGTSSARGKQVLPLAALTSLCKDFELTPSILPRENAHRIYVQLVYPNETLLTPESIAAREGSSRGGRNGNDGRGDNARGSVAPAAGVGLGMGEWMAWLGLVGIGCTWFDKQRGLYNTPTEKVLGLLQWMECSGGKARISSTRGAAVVPAFNLLPLQGTSRTRR